MAKNLHRIPYIIGALPSVGSLSKCGVDLVCALGGMEVAVYSAIGKSPVCRKYRYLPYSRNVQSPKCRIWIGRYGMSHVTGKLIFFSQARSPK